MPQFRDLGILRALEELGLGQRARAVLKSIEGLEVPLDAPVRELPTPRAAITGPTEYPSILERNPLNWKPPSLRKLWNREV
jgi:hypothetical protein